MLDNFSGMFLCRLLFALDSLPFSGSLTVKLASLKKVFALPKARSLSLSHSLSFFLSVVLCSMLPHSHKFAISGEVLTHTKNESNFANTYWTLTLKETSSHRPPSSMKFSDLFSAGFSPKKTAKFTQRATKPVRHHKTCQPMQVSATFCKIYSQD